VRELELERRYLAKSIPLQLDKLPFKHVSDKYFPSNAKHPKTRIRQIDTSYLIAKKKRRKGFDISNYIEDTIILSKAEYTSLSMLPGKELYKTRYYYEEASYKVMYDVFQKKLAGLIIIEVEFLNNDIILPSILSKYCLCDITHEVKLASGVLAGKSYEQIKPLLDTYVYNKLMV
jgi:CYTH domain-containing protein